MTKLIADIIQNFGIPGLIAAASVTLFVTWGLPRNAERKLRLQAYGIAKEMAEYSETHDISWQGELTRRFLVALGVLAHEGPRNWVDRWREESRLLTDKPPSPQELEFLRRRAVRIQAALERYSRVARLGGLIVETRFCELVLSSSADSSRGKGI